MCVCVCVCVCVYTHKLSRVREHIIVCYVPYETVKYPIDTCSITGCFFVVMYLYEYIAKRYNKQVNVYYNTKRLTVSLRYWSFVVLGKLNTNDRLIKLTELKK